MTQIRGIRVVAEELQENTCDKLKKPDIYAELQCSMFTPLGSRLDIVWLSEEKTLTSVVTAILNVKNETRSIRVSAMFANVLYILLTSHRIALQIIGI